MCHCKDVEQARGAYCHARHTRHGSAEALLQEVVHETHQAHDRMVQVVLWNTVQVGLGTAQDREVPQPMLGGQALVCHKQQSSVLAATTMHLGVLNLDEAEPTVLGGRPACTKQMQAVDWSGINALAE